ncbi:cleavage stimulation factor subunit 2 [Pancytospora epiphaga]|nr:cleavage stimulation factor subunit 2 [Pancytospora epiphaga]
MKNGCSVFVGNIDFDVPEQKVIEELSTVGKVVSFRLMYDKNTGRSKGYGFCEYESPLIAETAMKTLKIQFNGRIVKINYAENDLPSKIRDTTPKPLQIDSIIQALDMFEKENIKEVVDYCKKMAVDQPTQLKELFSKHPNLLVAVLSTIVKLKLVDSEKVSEVLERSFDPIKLKEQIAHRIPSLGDAELAGMSEDVRKRVNKLKFLLSKKEFK